VCRVPVLWVHTCPEGGMGRVPVLWVHTCPEGGMGTVDSRPSSVG
jgi:hypothetical protein